MNKQITYTSRTLKVVLFLLVITMIAITFFACGSKKKATNKTKEQTQTEVKKDVAQTVETNEEKTVEKEETTQKDISATSENKTLEVEPIEPEKETVLIINKDTLKFQNGKIKYSNSRSDQTQNEETTKKEKTTTSGTTKTENKDRSTEKSNTKKEAVTKKKEQKGKMSFGFWFWVIIVSVTYVAIRLFMGKSIIPIAGIRKLFNSKNQQNV